MALVNGGLLHFKDMKKFLKNLLRNCWSDFEIIYRNLGLTLADIRIRAVIAMGKLPSPFVRPLGNKNFQVFIADTGSV